MTLSNPPAPITIAILAGGQSRRMGQDKASLQLGGQSWLARLVDAALAVSPSVAVVGRAGARAGIHWLCDDTPGLGPMGGLRTALANLGQPVLLVGCDMPRVDAEALGWLMRVARTSGAAYGLATQRGGQIEPLFSVYDPAVLPRVDARIAAGDLSLRRLIAAGGFDRVEPPPSVGERLLNINTPGELREFLGPKG